MKKVHSKGMEKFWRIVNKVVEKSDIVLEVLDARFAQQTRNPQLEKRVQDKGKQIIYVINKSDLVTSRKMKELGEQLIPSVYLSAVKHQGTAKLRDLIKRYAKNDPTFVGVVGYPNTGKSSVINVLAGRAAAKTAPKSGQTRGMQLIRLTQKIKLIDTPGVLPPEDPVIQAILGAIEITKVKDPDYVVEQLMELFPKVIEKHYDIKDLEDYAEKNHFLRKGGVPDVERAARKILSDWQQGKIPLSL